jgi:hypothetical protein
VTPNRSAGRLDDDTWGRFLAWARAMGLSNSDAMRELINAHCGTPPGPAGRHAATLDSPAQAAPRGRPG